MRYVAAYLLATLGGAEQPSVADIKKILGSVGIETQESRAEELISKLSGKQIENVIAEGSSKLASMPAGGAAPAAASAPASGAAAPAAAKAEKKVEKEESDEDMGFGLFD